MSPKNQSRRKNPIYNIWLGIKTRCYNTNRADYKYYGGRGIKLADEFADFTAFFEYVSKLPRYENREKEKLTLDRADNSKSYERGNLRWASRKEQSNNQRKKFGIVPTEKCGRLLVLRSFLYKKRTYVECLCDCGGKKLCRLSHINSGGIKSCGCLQKDNAAKMGFANRKRKRVLKISSQ